MLNLTRTAVEVPKSCYGLEHDRLDPVCQQCQFQADCRVVSTTRVGKVPLSRVEFDFMPAELSKFAVDDDDENIERTYRLCYRLIFDDAEPDSLRRFQTADADLKRLALEVGCSTRMFITCVMLARKQLAPGTRFFASYLFSKGSSRLVEDYRALARDKYGSFDYDSLSMLTGGDELTNAKKRLLNSEVLAGTWIVGHKIRFAGSPTESFYNSNELRLDPVWLCLEPSYYEYNVSHPPISDAIQRHRQNVYKSNGWLRKKNDVAAAYFHARNFMFKQAVVEVLDHNGFKPDDFEGPALVTDSVKFWSRVALAIQHVACLHIAGVL